jgi:hypothetical protein
MDTPADEQEIGFKGFFKMQITISNKLVLKNMSDALF